MIKSTATRACATRAGRELTATAVSLVYSTLYRASPEYVTFCLERRSSATPWLPGKYSYTVFAQVFASLNRIACWTVLDSSCREVAGLTPPKAVADPH